MKIFDTEKITKRKNIIVALSMRLDLLGSNLQVGYFRWYKKKYELNLNKLPDNEKLLFRKTRIVKAHKSSNRSYRRVYRSGVLADFLNHVSTIGEVKIVESKIGSFLMVYLGRVERRTQPKTRKSSNQNADGTFLFLPHSRRKLEAKSVFDRICVSESVIQDVCTGLIKCSVGCGSPLPLP